MNPLALGLVIFDALIWTFNAAQIVAMAGIFV